MGKKMMHKCGGCDSKTCPNGNMENRQKVVELSSLERGKFKKALMDCGIKPCQNCIKEALNSNQSA